MFDILVYYLAVIYIASVIASIGIIVFTLQFIPLKLLIPYWIYYTIVVMAWITVIIGLPLIVFAVWVLWSGFVSMLKAIFGKI